jgi:putative ABC transport system permease protein
MARLLNLIPWRRDRLDRQLERELRYHLDRRVEELIAEGLGEAEARRRAGLEFGGVTQVREAVRETWTWRWLDTALLDLRYAARSLRRSWGFTLGVGAVLALAIGANVAIFSVVNAVLLQPLAYPDAERLVSVETLWTNTGQLSPDVSGPDFLDWQARDDVFDKLAVTFGEDDTATLVGDRAVFANDRYVSADFFAVFGLAPAAGRLLTEQDVPSGDADPTVAVVAHRWATAHFGGPEAALGQSIRVYGRARRIVGVAAPGFSHPGGADIWSPWRAERGGADRSAHNYEAVGKLAARTDLAEARARLRALGDELARRYPENRLKNVALVPLQERLTGPVRGTLWALMAAVGSVLLIACANIANLLIARAAGRTREIALRAALGAGRARVARQLLTESGLLAGTAALVGLALASWLARALLALSPVGLARAGEVRLDPTVVAFALGLSSIVTLAFGLLPALRASRLDLLPALQRGGSKGEVSGAGGRLRSSLVVAEVALSVVLLVAAGLLLRSFLALQRVDLGFATQGVLVTYTQYPVNGEEQGRARIAFYASLLDRLHAVPGVTSAAGVNLLPLGREPRPAREYFVQGRPEGQPGEQPKAHIYAVTPHYFRTLEIPLRSGRDFDRTDTVERPRVAIINEALARAAFPRESPLGQHIRWNSRAPWMEIVGVVADTRWQDPSRRPAPALFVASAQGLGGSLSILARTSLDQASLAGTLRQLVQDAAPSVPVRFETMGELFESALAYHRFRAQMIGVFAGAASLLAAVGLFSVLAYVVGQRTRELAVRRAVGAQAADVVRLIVGRGLRLVALGLMLGLAGALAVARGLAGLLYGISPWDIGTYLAATAVLGLAALLATLLPALRATRIAPLVALQQE